MKKLIIMSVLALFSFGAVAQTYLMREHIAGMSPSTSSGGDVSTGTGSTSSSGAGSASSDQAMSSSSAQSSSLASSSTPILTTDYSMSIAGFVSGVNRLNINVNFVQSEQTIYFVATGPTPAQIILTFSNGEVHQFAGLAGKTFSMPLQIPHQQQLFLTGKIGVNDISFNTSDGVFGDTRIFF